MNVEKLMNKRGGRPLKVLIVDDEERIRDIFRDFCLATPLFDVKTARNGQEAIDLVAQEEFDIVTLDLIMPEVSGLEAIDNIKRLRPRLPVVIVTGNATDNLVRKAGQLGGCRVLHKPVSIDDFINELIDVADEKLG